MGASPPAGNYVLPTVLVGFKRLHPLITLHLRVASGPQMGADMLSGVNDFAVAEVGGDLPDGLATEPLWDEPIVLFCAPGSPLASGPVSASTLAGEPMVGNAGAGLVRSQLEWQMASLGVQLRPPALDLSTTEAVKRAVSGGAGIAAAYRCEVADDLKAGTLCELHTPDLDLYQTFALVYRRNKRFSPVARRLLDHLRGHWAEG